MVLSLEGFRAEAAHVLPLITVSKLVFSECTRVVERLTAYGALRTIRAWRHLARPPLGTRFGGFCRLLDVD